MYDSSLYYHHKALDISLKLTNPLEIEKMYNNIAITYGEIKNEKQVILYAIKADSIAYYIGQIQTQALAKKSLSTAYQAIHQYSTALFYHQQYKQLNDSVFLPRKF